MPDASFLSSDLFLLTLTVGLYCLGGMIYRRTRLPLLHPVLLTFVAVIVFLRCAGIGYERYRDATGILNFALGMSVVALDCSATDMIHAISKGGLGLIIICDGERIEGIVTDGDVRRAMERRRAEFFNIKAADIATPNPKTISPDEKLIEAEKMMTRNKVTSLLVTDDAGKLQGVIQIYDIKL